ncbi:nitroreductase family protein [Metaclostridioides mangenotii]|uniref:nitroreductase family protein n=1 Tax=Metaclostridioides mangenotii TaxID=1540 RepID=UPI001639BFF4|nr:nitroreductase family protein [Clostridioides mangenotii]
MNTCPMIEVVSCLITFGYTDDPDEQENKLHNFVYSNRKPLDQQYTTEGTQPTWFMVGMKSVEKAPSAKNLRLPIFNNDNGVVTVTLPDKSLDTSSAGVEVDLGIAKLHFEVGAGKGTWEWGDNAKFHI